MNYTGMQYIPRDNSYSKNLSSDKKESDFLAGNYKSMAQVTTIISEPFPVVISGRVNKEPLDFVLVTDRNNETHFVLFIKSGVITSDNTIENLLIDDANRRSLIDFNWLQ